MSCAGKLDWPSDRGPACKDPSAVLVWLKPTTRDSLHTLPAYDTQVLATGNLVTVERAHVFPRPPFPAFRSAGVRALLCDFNRRKGLQPPERALRCWSKLGPVTASKLHFCADFSS